MPSSAHITPALGFLPFWSRSPDRCLPVQVSSYFYFMMVCPVLRYGPNKERFPYGEVLEDQEDVKSIYGDARLDPARGFLSDENFDAAMLFACEFFSWIYLSFAFPCL